MNVVDLDIPVVKLITPRVFEDARGFFMETYNAVRYASVGINATFVQDNHSKSVKDTLRGLHYQLNKPQGKLVRVVSGEVFDVAVDIRKGSPTFGKWVGVVLNASNKLQLYVPPRFAHGFCVLSDTAEFLYKCTDYYSPDDERGIVWNDPQLAIDWPIRMPILSEKDKSYATIAEMEHELPVYKEEV